MSSSEASLRSALADWLTYRLPSAQAVGVDRFEQPKAGFSNDTIVFDAHIETSTGQDERRYVLRRGGTGEAIYPVQAAAIGSSVELQYRVMNALAMHGNAPVAPILGWEPDIAPLGQPFFVMDFVSGRVLPDFPSYASEGFYAERTSPTVRRRMVESGLEAMAEIHRLDWQKADLVWLDRASQGGSSMTAQLELWRTYLDSVPGCREHALLQSSLRWIEEQCPSSEVASALSWGDARIQNMIFSDLGECLSIMDWEGAAILPPEVDLAWWLGVDDYVHEASGVSRLPGEPTSEEQVAYYEAKLGRPVRDLEYFRVFAAFRTVALMISTYDRLAAMGVSEAGSASENPFEGLLEAAIENASN